MRTLSLDTPLHDALHSDPNLKEGHRKVCNKCQGAGRNCEGGSVFRLPELTKSCVSVLEWGDTREEYLPCIYALSLILDRE